MQIDTPILISIISAIAACAAAIFAFRSYQLTNRALLLSEEEAERRNPNLTPYLHEGFTSLSSKKDLKVYAFSLSVIDVWVGSR